MTEQNIRPLEDGIERDLEKMSTTAATCVWTACCRPGPPLGPSRRAAVHRPAPDHASCGSSCSSTSCARPMALLAADDLGPALKRLARVKHIQHR